MRKIIIITLLFILIISVFYNSFAFEIGNKELISLGECDKLLRYKSEDRFVQYVVYKKDGKTYPAYCLQPDKIGVGTNGTASYTVSGTTRLENENLWRVLINGYPYKTLAELGVSTIDEAYTATKFALYTVIENRNESDYSPIETEAAKRTYQAYLKILKDAKNSNEILKDNNKLSIIPDSEEWDIDSINNDYVSKTYNVSSIIKNGNYTVQIQGTVPYGSKITNLENDESNTFKLGDKFKILIPVKELKENNEFTINVTSDLETKPVVYGKTSIDGTQDYAITGYMTEPCKGTLQENCQKNITKIMIIKKEYGTEKRLQGVIFNLLDESKNIIQKEMETNENGEIIFENISSGKYYIQEVQTLDGYNLYTDLIEIDIDFNEEVEVIINNTVKSISEVNLNKDTVEIVPKYTETIYNVEENTTKINNNENIKKLPVTGY